ncbi:MAG: pyridoxamine 5'-phosphate oxidase [Alphaproteobacteria bacterium]
MTSATVDKPATSLEQDPIARFQAWYAEAEQAEPGLADAMVLATVGPGGAPSARVVLLKDHDRRGFTFYSNLGSRKGDEMDANPLVALCFHWKSLGRQVRIEGAIEPVNAAEADAYFTSRPRGSQLGAWASRQSQPLANRDELVARIAMFDERFADTAITRPPFWSGYRVVPANMEFWRHGDDRLHERLRFERGGEDSWTTQYLYP